jgi:hypothetical protein
MNKFCQSVTVSLALALGSSPLLAWTCNDKGIPHQCSSLDSSGAYTANTQGCLESLLACGRYKELVALADINKLGIDRHYNFYLGAAYFGLAGRTDAQSLRCYYNKRSSTQLQEFLSKTEGMDASAVTYGSDSEMDMLYFAARSLDNLKKEPGCFDSSYSDGTLYLKAKGQTSALMKNLLQDSGTDRPSSAAGTVQEGFKAIRDSMNTFVTVTAQMEERVTNYGAQIAIGRDTVGKIVGLLQSSFSESAVSYNLGAGGRPVLFMNRTAIDERLGTVDQTLSSWENRLQASEKGLDDFIRKSVTTGYYDKLQESNLQKIDNLSTELTAAINAFGNSEGRKKELLSLAQKMVPPNAVELTLKSMMKDYQSAITSKNMCDWPNSGWYCPTEN